MELKKITEQVYYLPNAANIGLIIEQNQAVLIDSGLDDSTAKQLLSLLEEQGLELIGIINTHSHADHCGGNAYLQTNTQAKIYAPEIEAGIVQYSYLEPLYLFSGAHPVADLQNKFLMAEPSQVDQTIVSTADQLSVGGIKLGVVSLPGHSPNQIGIERNGVLFCGDAVFAPEVLAKHKIPFYTNIDRQKETLHWLTDSNYEFYLPAHGELTQDIGELVAANLAIITEVEDYIKKILAEQPKSTEQVLKEVCDAYDIQLAGAQKYYLMNTVVMAYLSSLSNQEEVETKIEGNELKWSGV